MHRGNLREQIPRSRKAILSRTVRPHSILNVLQISQEASTFPKLIHPVHREPVRRPRRCLEHNDMGLTAFQKKLRSQTARNQSLDRAREGKHIPISTIKQTAFRVPLQCYFVHHHIVFLCALMSPALANPRRSIRILSTSNNNTKQQY